MLNARDAGIVLQAFPESAGTQTLPKIVRVRLETSDPQAALAGAVASIDPSQMTRVLNAKSHEELYQAERALLDDHRVIPIAHVTQSYVLTPRIHDWMMKREGSLPLDNLWLEGGQ